MSSVLRHFGLSLRTLGKSPGTSALAILVLGLAIGANSAMFSVVNTLVLKPLAIPEPEQLSLVLRHDLERRDYDSVSYPDFVDLRENLRTFQSLTAHTMAMVGLGEGADARRSFVDLVPANYFQTFGVAPALGRAFTEEEERPDALIPVAIVSHRGWQRLGGNEEVLGSSIVVNGIETTVVGVAPRNFSGTSALLAPELYMPLGMAGRLSENLSAGRGSLSERTTQELLLIGRLHIGTSRAEADEDLARVSAVLAEQYPGTSRGVVYEAHPPSRVSVSTSPQEDSMMTVLSALLLSMSLVVLLVAGFNLAAVQGARNLSRRREFAVRLALGSGRLRVVQQLVTESLVLALGGAALGLFIAWLAPRLLVASLSRIAPFDIYLDGSLDWRILLATLGFAMLAALFVGLLPALRATRPDLSEDLKEGREQPGGGRGRLGFSRGDLPVTFQLALSTVLLVCAGLFVQSALRGANVDPGFETSRHVLLEVDPSLAGYDAEQTRSLQDRLRQRLEALPGVRRVALAGTTPYGMVSFGASVVDADQPPTEGETDGQSAGLYLVSDGYFDSLSIPLIRGREFLPVEATPVAVIDEVLAERLFGGTEALGRRIALPNSERLEGAAEVVGVVKSIRDSLFDRQAQAHLYLSASRQEIFNTQMHIATQRPPDAALIGAVREVVRTVDPGLAVLTLSSFDDFLERGVEVWTLRTGARLFSVFAALALVLAVAGVYGVQAYRIVQRTREIGLRVALGATFRDTVGLIFRDGFRVAALGTTIGILLAAGAAQLLRVMLVDTEPTDPVVFVGAWLLLVATASLATLIPARRAAKLDPLVALREE